MVEINSQQKATICGKLLGIRRQDESTAVLKIMATPKLSNG